MVKCGQEDTVLEKFMMWPVNSFNQVTIPCPLEVEIVFENFFEPVPIVGH